MVDRHPMTVTGHKALQDELNELKRVERPKIVKAIEEARAHGDLSENAEYDAAKNAQGMLEGRIREIEAKLAAAQIVDVNKLSGEKVTFGASVSLIDIDTDEEKQVHIVGEDQADAEAGMISFSSPLARGLIGKSIDDVVKVPLPGGAKEYEIVGVDFAEKN